MQALPDECACEVLETVPLVMRVIRAEMRSHRTPDLSVSQFRTLTFLNHHEGASLGDVAEHIGLTLPSMSMMVDKLVVRNLVERRTSPTDRRRVTLTLTMDGKAMLEAARQDTQAHLAEVLAALSADERATVVQAMQVLRPVFTPGRGTRSETDR
jgi:DNA-binding MarR family transcriptional regulator